MFIVKPYKTMGNEFDSSPEPCYHVPMVAIVCQSCGEPFDVPEEARGKKALCPVCGEETPVPVVAIFQSRLSLTSGRLDPPTIRPFFSHPVWKLAAKIGGIAAIVALFFGALILVHSILTRVAGDVHPRGIKAGHTPSIKDKTSPSFNSIEKLYSAIQLFKQRFGRIPENLAEFPGSNIPPGAARDFIYIPQASRLGSNGKYVLLAENSPGTGNETRLYYTDGSMASLARDVVEVEVRRTMLAISDAEGIAEVAAIAAKLKQEASASLDAARRAESEGDLQAALVMYGAIRKDFTGVPEIRRMVSLIDEKMKTLTFRIRLGKARAAVVGTSAGVAGLNSHAEELYDSLQSDFPESIDAIEAERSLWQLARDAAELVRRGLYKQALEVARLIGIQDDLFWKRFAVLRTKEINRFLGRAKGTFHLAAGAAKKGEFALAYRLYSNVEKTSPLTEWGVDSGLAKRLLIMKMPYGRRFQLKSRFNLPEVRSVISHGLDYLARHQDNSGGWAADAYTEHCLEKRCRGKGMAEFDVGVTALAMFTFLGEGSTHFTGRHTSVVKKGLRFLLASQDSDGYIGRNSSERWVYNHALATAVLAEALSMTGDVSMKKQVSDAVAALLNLQKPGRGWTYGRRGEGDVSLTSIAAWALASALRAGIDVPGVSTDGVKKIITDAMDKEAGAVSYRAGRKLSNSFPQKSGRGANLPALAAQVACTRMMLGSGPEEKEVQSAVEAIRKSLPVWDRPELKHVDFYYWYFATLTLGAASEEGLKEWNHTLKPLLLVNQEKSGCEAGSWPPEGRWSATGGRIYSTALCIMILQAPYNRPADFPGSLK